jgi:predicted aconitase with swiveling domain
MSPCSSHCCWISLDRAPHVGSVPRPSYVLSNQARTGTASLAIWNKKNIIVAVANGVLGINVISLIQGKLSILVKVQKSDVI